MTRPAAALAACTFVLSSALVAGCATGAAGHANAAGSVYLQAVAPVNRDAAKLDLMIDAGDTNVDDYTKLCVQFSTDQAGFAAALRAYRWPAAARGDAAALAAAAARSGTYYLRIASDTTTTELSQDFNELPSDRAQANALRADVGLPPAR